MRLRCIDPRPHRLAATPALGSPKSTVLTTLHMVSSTFPRRLPDIIREFRQKLLSFRFRRISDWHFRARGGVPHTRVSAGCATLNLLWPSLRGWLIIRRFLGRLTAERATKKTLADPLGRARARRKALRIAAKYLVPRPLTSKGILQHYHRGDQGVRYPGEINDAGKQAFLAEAAALMFPINWQSLLASAS